MLYITQRRDATSNTIVLDVAPQPAVIQIQKKPNSVTAIALLGCFYVVSIFVLDVAPQPAVIHSHTVVITRPRLGLAL